MRNKQAELAKATLKASSSNPVTKKTLTSSVATQEKQKPVPTGERITTTVRERANMPPPNPIVQSSVVDATPIGEGVDDSSFIREPYDTARSENNSSRTSSTQPIVQVLSTPYRVLTLNDMNHQARQTIRQGPLHCGRSRYRLADQRNGRSRFTS